jgi:chemotaxis signal transduction protein
MNRVRQIQRADCLQTQAGSNGSIGVVPGPEADVPVYSLARLLGQSDAITNRLQLILVLNTKPQPTGLLVDEVSQIIRVDPRAVRPLPAQLGAANHRCCAGVVQHESELLLLLTPDHLIPGTVPAMAELTESIAETIDPLSGPSPRFGDERQLVVFATGNATKCIRPVVFGLSITQVLEVLARPKLLTVPLTSNCVLGLTYWRARPVAVFDLSRCLGLEPSDFRQCSRLIIARPSTLAPPIGFLVLPFIRLLRLPLPHHPSEPSVLGNLPAIRGIVELRNETLILPDLRILADPK